MRKFVKRHFPAQALYPFFMRLRSFTGKHFFLFLCFGGLLWYALFTRQIIGQIRKDSVRVTQTYAELIKTALSQRMNNQEIEVIFQEVIQKLHFPIIVTDTSWRPIIWKNITTGPLWNREHIAPNDTAAISKEEIRKKIEDFRATYEPKPIIIHETGTKIGYLVYSNSDRLKTLEWMPFLEIGLVVAVMLLAYLAFHSVRVTERSNLWVGLAKETAHQLGTPISSLMGWVEYLEAAPEGEDGPEPEELIGQVGKICGNMKGDLIRLRKITNRFNQIGSVPDLFPSNINKVVEDAMQYFSARLPVLGRKIEIQKDFGVLPEVPCNRDLMEWVIENLQKNALDAIRSQNGLIELKTEYISDNKMVRIIHKDNGKGIQWEDRKKVFSPGYTTKKRGWGLGLTLAKRIVEDYHNGLIYVHWSQKGKGTIFHIDLPVRRTT
ncbi:MAG: two-component sensor histidine kinase [Chitinivibrionales bacterium]|nr:two-component sensor histidine kinase [Chitinivibrionales bacterium]